MDEQVRAPRAADLRHLAAVEDAGLAMYVAALGEDGVGPALRAPAPSGAERDAAPGRLHVVGRPVVGFAHVLHLGDLGDTGAEAHLEQLSVHPEHQRRGLGSRLVRAAAQQAAADGHDVLTLCTYRDLAWNAPFYAGLGFAEVAPEQQTPLLRRIRRHEVALGLDGSGPRVVMALRLDRPPQVTGE